MNDKRSKLGMRVGAVGILSNLLLFVMKIVVGIASNSTAIIGDAINNLSDFLSSLITVFGFKLSSLPPDREHPYGHARFELISGFVISIIMLYLGIDVFRESFLQILNPDSLLSSPTMFIILFISVIVKIFQMLFYRRMFNITKSEVIEANIKDSRNDVLITSSIIIGIWVQSISGYRVDGFLGILISILIIWSSLTMLKDFVHDLLGSRPDEALIEGIQNIFDSADDIIGYHDLIIHSYGVNRHYATVHVEIDKDTSLEDAHTIIDKLEYRVLKEFDVDMVIHLDPLDLDSPLLLDLNRKVEASLYQIDPRLTYHDLRLFHNNLIFDVVVPEKIDLSDQELLEKISECLNDEPYRVKVTFDRNYLLD